MRASRKLAQDKYPYGEAGRNNSPTPDVQRTLPAATSYYTRAEGKRRFFALDEKPDCLKHLDTIDKSAWKQYQAHLARITPLQRAEFYRDMMAQRKIQSVCALARVLGKDEAAIRQYLNLLRLPEPIQQFLKDNRHPAYVRYFSYKRLRPLLKLDPRSAWRAFQQMLADARREAGVWSDFEQEVSKEPR